MAISGPEALRSLDDAVRDIRREEADITRRLSRGAERIAKLRETEAELFRQLAEIRLSPDVRVQMAGRLIAAEERAREMVTHHADALSEANAAMAKLDAEVAGQAKMRRAILERIDEAQKELKALSDKIAKATARDPAYEAKQHEAAELQHVAERSMAKTEQAEADKEQKGKPYRDDPLFMYLWEAGYGTRSYKANNLIRRLDAQVARLVRYEDARPNFAMLNEIPIRLREHAERQQDAARKAEAELDALEAKAIDAAGGKPMREALSKAQAELEAHDAAMAELEDRRDAQAETLRHLSEGRDPAFAEAHTILAESLGQQDLQTLLADARRTRTPEDDAVLARIDDTRSRIADEEAEASDQQARLKTLARRRREIEDIQWEFKKARFDDPRSTFREGNLTGDILGEFLRGGITAAAYWDQWRRSQSWRPGSTDWGGGFGLPRSGRMSRNSGGFGWPGAGGPSGGFSRPRTGARGTRRQGGFKTGGGF